jgi:3-hydroxyisobutyrate dehydrogenase-like beta-hydroxyacid dehydrogenase
MGQPMAHKLLDAGHTLTIYDINEAAMRPLLERQARRAASPRGSMRDRVRLAADVGRIREVAFGDMRASVGSSRDRDQSPAQCYL